MIFSGRLIGGREGARVGEATARVLFVDDDPMIGTALTRLLGSAHDVVVADGGYAVDVASDEGQAILATRAARESVVESPSDEAATPVAALPDAPSAPPLAPHARHGTRVGDFSAASVTASAAASGEPAPDPQNEVPAVARVAAPATDNPAAP